MDGRKRKVAWGITGCGDKLRETVDTMMEIGEVYLDELDIEVFLSKAGEQVVKYYKILEDLREHFKRVWAERNANSPFLAGRLQLGEFDFLLIAPATSNTVAKLSHGIADTMLTNGAIQSLKVSIPVYILPGDFREGTIITELPNGSDLKIKVRKEDVDNVKKLLTMKDVYPFENPEEIAQIFRNHFE